MESMKEFLGFQSSLDKGATSLETDVFPVFHGQPIVKKWQLGNEGWQRLHLKLFFIKIGSYLFLLI